MCNQHHQYNPNPEIVQLMPVQNNLYAVYNSNEAKDYCTAEGKANLSLVPVLFMGLIRHGDKTMVEGFFAAGAIQSCEDVNGFMGYAASLDDAEKLYV